jgi:hypothetical protein
VNQEQLIEFVRESNAIERIYREPSEEEINELDRFIHKKRITIEWLNQFVSIYQSDAKLRRDYGMDVRVGKYVPPMGGPEVSDILIKILCRQRSLTPSALHIVYEKLHPYTDCNGRSGRALWLWRMIQDSYPIYEGFLGTFFVQTGVKAERLEELSHMKDTLSPQDMIEFLLSYYYRTLGEQPHNFKYLELIPSDVIEPQ